MKITVITVGKIKEKYLKDAIAEYSKRLSKYCKLEIIEVADEKTPDAASETVERQIRQKEGERILKHIKEDSYVITLEIGGAMLDSVAFAKKIEKAIFPNDLHFKVALTGCSNDCIKARMNDFGIIGMTEPQYDSNRCVSCGACVRVCKRKSTGALSAENYTVVRDHERCIGCGECVIACPTRAMTRSKEKYYRLVIMGRTGKKNPRLAEDFLIWADEESIRKIIKNTYKYVTEYIDPKAPGGKEHIGYIIDRTGFMEYKKWALEGVELSDKAIMKNNVYWSGVRYK